MRTLTPISLAFALFAGASGALAQDPPSPRPSPRPPEPPSIAAALTDEVIRIGPRFTGARITVYGVARGLMEGDDVVVVVRGPERPLVVMRKRRTFGIWINGAGARFEGAPAYYATASTRPLNLVAPPNNLRRFGIGAEHAPLRAVGERGASVAANIAEYRRAIVRDSGRDGLYRDEPEGVDLLDGGLFRAEVTLPERSPTGEYTAEVFLFRDGAMEARRTVQLNVQKVGLERWLYSFAHDRPIIYGITAVALAMASGLIAAAAFRRR